MQHYNNMYDSLILAESLGLKETLKYRYLIYAKSPLYFILQRYNKELKTVVEVTLSKELFDRVSNDEKLKNQMLTAWNNLFDEAEQRLLEGK